MFNRHVLPQLAAYIDGALSPQEAARVERHAARCAECRAQRERIEFGMEALERIELVEPPEAVWLAIEAELRANPVPRRVNAVRMIAYATAVLAIFGIAYWTVARRARIGEWIETGSHSTVSIKIGKIGSVEIEPNTRLRVVKALPGEHRLALARGEIRAKISAPPKLFFVDTASGTAVDLGCEYTLNTNEDGFGLLRVTKGWVSFQWKGLESLVPAGASCRTRPVTGPGIPYFDDAPEKLKQALDQDGGGALDMILAQARVRDTLTLWHLLSRVEAADRARVYDRIAALTPVPPGVSREQALKLDPATLTRWKDELAWTW
jgi:predicted anti-sigma-YlaC factor YlaD